MILHIVSCKGRCELERRPIYIVDHNTVTAAEERRLYYDQYNRLIDRLITKTTEEITERALRLITKTTEEITDGPSGRPE